MPGGPPGEGPGLQVRAELPGQVQAAVHAAVASGARGDVTPRHVTRAPARAQPAYKL